jgi:hypothetical protein
VRPELVNKWRNSMVMMVMMMMIIIIVIKLTKEESVIHKRLVLSGYIRSE